MTRYIFTTLFVSTLAYAELLVSPLTVMQENFPAATAIQKKNIILTNKEAHTIEQKAHVKLKSKIFRVYIAKKDADTLGYGILVNQKVRSKNSVILYTIANNTLIDTEIIAFNEPKEYLPSKHWIQQLHNIPTTQMLYLNRDIPTITGATLSARSTIRAARIALALYTTKFQGD